MGQGHSRRLLHKTDMLKDTSNAANNGYVATGTIESRCACCMP